MLKIAIERKRNLMISVAGKYGLDAEETIKHSQELDKLLNLDHFMENYKKIIKKKIISLYSVIRTFLSSLSLKRIYK